MLAAALDSRTPARAGDGRSAAGGDPVVATAPAPAWPTITIIAVATIERRACEAKERRYPEVKAGPLAISPVALGGGSSSGERERGSWRTGLVRRYARSASLPTGPMVPVR
jgi:hypothetical protein